MLYTAWAGPEIAVATTKAYSTQLSVIYMIALYLAEKRGTVSEKEYAEIIDGIEKLPDMVGEILKNKDNVQFLASKFFSSKSIFFIGRNLDYAVALERLAEA